MAEIESQELFKIIGSNIKFYRKLYNLKKGKMTPSPISWTH